MEKLTKERAQLLKKLFNLSTDESTIICEINKRIDNCNKKEETTKKEKEANERKRKELETELLSFSSQAKDFLGTFGRYNNSSFEKLKKIDIDIEIGTLINKVKKSVPTYEKELNKDIKEQINGITNCSKKLKDINREREEAKKELGIAQEKKENLSNLLEDVLVNNNISSYTRGYINKILKEIDAFKPEEIEELEFLILFPENGLKAYKENPDEYEVEEEIPEGEFIDLKEEGTKKPLGPSLKETMELMRSKKEEEPVKLGPSLKETMDKMKADKKPLGPSLKETMDKMKADKKTLGPSLKETMELMKAEREQQEEVEETEEAKEYVYAEEEQEEPAETYEETSEEVEKVVEEIKSEDQFNEDLDDIGLDLNVVDINDRTRVTKEIQNADKKVLKANYELLQALDLEDEDIYTISDNNYMYLTDPELNNKITIIRGKGIKDSVIKNHIVNEGLQMTVEELADRIKAISTLEGDLKESNLYLIEHNLTNYENNINKLKEAGIELDTKETRNYMAVLERCNNIDKMIELITTYVVNLSKKNGKYELNILLNNTKDIMLNIDDLAEQGLEEQVSETPEIFDYNIDAILDRIYYSKENSITIYDEEDNTIKNYIYDGREFRDSYPDAKYNKLKTREEVNNELKEAYNDEYATLLIEKLDNYYKELKEFEVVEANNKELYNNLLVTAEKELDINTVGKNTSKLKYANISKNKLERNLAVLINEVEEEKINSNTKTTIIIAALYNLRIPEMEKMVEDCK